MIDEVLYLLEASWRVVKFTVFEVVPLLLALGVLLAWLAYVAR